MAEFLYSTCRLGSFDLVKNRIVFPVDGEHIIVIETSVKADDLCGVVSLSRTEPEPCSFCCGIRRGCSVKASKGIKS